jgi:hypothetical protein
VGAWLCLLGAGVLNVPGYCWCVLVGAMDDDSGQAGGCWLCPLLLNVPLGAARLCACRALVLLSGVLLLVC